MEIFIRQSKSNDHMNNRYGRFETFTKQREEKNCSSYSVGACYFLTFIPIPVVGARTMCIAICISQTANEQNYYNLAFGAPAWSPSLCLFIVGYLSYSSDPPFLPPVLCSSCEHYGRRAHFFVVHSVAPLPIRSKSLFIFFCFYFLFTLTTSQAHERACCCFVSMTRLRFGSHECLRSIQLHICTNKK